MDIASLYCKLRFARLQMISAAGTSAHRHWVNIVRETEQTIKALAVCETVSA